MSKIKNGGRLTDAQVGFLLIVPGLAFFIAIILYPFLDAIMTSFTDKSLLFPTYKIIGLENYEKVLSNPYFGKTVLTTVIFVLGSTIFPYVLGMIWAIVLNQGFKGAEFLRGVTLVNWIVPGIAIGFLWTWIFNGQYGILNSFLEAIGLIDDGIPCARRVCSAVIGHCSLAMLYSPCLLAHGR